MCRVWCNVKLGWFVRRARWHNSFDKRTIPSVLFGAATSSRCYNCARHRRNRSTVRGRRGESLKSTVEGAHRRASGSRVGSPRERYAVRVAAVMLRWRRRHRSRILVDLEGVGGERFVRRGQESEVYEAGRVQQPMLPPSSTKRVRNWRRSERLAEKSSTAVPLEQFYPPPS